jgi:transcriptional regulator with XRE-family HTH domain
MEDLMFHLVPGPYDWTLGDRLRKVRRHHHLTQRQLAKVLGVRRGELAKWEAGQAQPGDGVSLAQRVSRVYGVPVNWLLGYVDHVGQASLIDEAS